MNIALQKVRRLKPQKPKHNEVIDGNFACQKGRYTDKEKENSNF